MDRRQLLEKLVDGPLNVPLVRTQLLALPYDCEEIFVVLGPSHISNALHQFLEGRVSADDVELWAELLEGRPGIAYQGADDESSVAESISQALFVLSTPDINGHLTHERARKIIKAISGVL